MFGNNDKRFFELLEGAAVNLVSCARLFAKGTAEAVDHASWAAEMKGLESKGDRFTHELGQLLNRLFMAPLDHDDILTLSLKMDDCVDALEAAAARIHIYRMSPNSQHIQRLAQLIVEQCEQVLEAVRRLAGKQLVSIRENTARIIALEKTADQTLREGLTALFAGRPDALEVMKHKEIIETLEEATDRNEDLADALESVVLKHA